tara:strand:+ start:750 stop:941 length:192 start_codon:yes stop_codon:yes gene_type:complete
MNNTLFFNKEVAKEIGEKAKKSNEPEILVIELKKILKDSQEKIQIIEKNLKLFTIATETYLFD